MTPKKSSRSPKPANADAKGVSRSAKRPASPRGPSASPKAPRSPQAGGRAVTRRKRAADTTQAVEDAGHPQVVVTDDHIRVRAYFLSIEHRGRNLSDAEIWLLAERELRNGKRSDAS